jgi:hypothetical protein
MNLLNRIIEDRPNILDFREYQYKLIPEILKLSFNYLQTLGFIFDPKNYKEEVVEDISYQSLNYFATRIYKIKLHDTKDCFLHLSIPILIENQFFKLNGALYVPGYWLVDSPITIKKKSVLCYSLFNPITFFNDDNRVIFLGHNIPICRFLRLFLQEHEIEFIVSSDYLNAKYTYEDYDYSMVKLGELIGGTLDPDVIKDKFNKIFFDNWTTGLYKEFYNIDEINLDILLYLLVDNLTKKDGKSFIDLHSKRLVFIEYFLTPFFKAISSASKYVLNGQTPYKLALNIGDIVKYFFIKMDKFNFYGVTNGFGGGLLDLKATFKNPNSSGELPSEVSSIHSSYKGKVDLVSISNTEPGKVISLVPNQNLKSLKYGIFTFDD